MDVGAARFWPRAPPALPSGPHWPRCDSNRKWLTAHQRPVVTVPAASRTALGCDADLRHLPVVGDHPLGQGQAGAATGLGLRCRSLPRPARTSGRSARSAQPTCGDRRFARHVILSDNQCQTATHSPSTHPRTAFGSMLPLSVPPPLERFGADCADKDQYLGASAGLQRHPYVPRRLTGSARGPRLERLG
jgi:hypothetical protein